MINQEEQKLISRIAEGDPEAENNLFFIYREKIKLMVRVRLKKRVSSYDQKDIISEINQAILTSLRRGGYDPTKGKAIEAYIAGIAGNIVAQYFRKQNTESGKKYLDSLQNFQTSENILYDLIDEEKNLKLRQCLMRIKPKYLEVLVLRFYEDKTIDEISLQLNIEKRRVSERINYAFKLLLSECKKNNYFQYYDDSNK